jgi:hypothetical protein
MSSKNVALDVVVSLLLVVLPVGGFVGASLAAASLEGCAPLEVFCFHPARFETESAARLGLSLAMALTAVAFLFVVPGLLGTLAFMRHRRTRKTAYVWSLVTNTAALIVLFLLLRLTVDLRLAVDVGRPAFLTGWWVWTLLLLTASWQRNETCGVLWGLCRRRGPALLIGLLAAVAAVVILFPEQFLQCFNEDGTENYELARSLRHHFLPAWELQTWKTQEVAKFGSVVVNPAVIYSYWTSGLQLLLGDGELATRLSYWVWWLGIFAISCRLVQPEPRGSGMLAAVPLALLMFLVSVLFSFYTGYNPYMADLANLGVQDALFAMLLLAGFDCVRHADRWGFISTMILATLSLYAGPIVCVLILAAAWIWQPMPRREVWRWSIRAAAALATVAGLYLVHGWWEGILPLWLETFDMEYLNDYLSDIPRWRSGLLFFAYLVLCCGGFPVVAMVQAYRRNAWQRTVATATLLYLMVILCSGFKNLHYLGLLLPVPVVLLLTTGLENERKLSVAKCLAATGSLLFCIWFCWPVERATFTLNRELGAKTTITTDSYEEAVLWARIQNSMRSFGDMSWDCDPHTWVAYSQLDSQLKAPRPLVLTISEAPGPQYHLVAKEQLAGTTIEVKLFARSPQDMAWLIRQRPAEPPGRYARVFIPIAAGPYSPHKNFATDVIRLQWPW